MNKPTDKEFEDWQMIPWLVGLGLRLKRLDGHEPREIQQIISLLRQLDGERIEGTATYEDDEWKFETGGIVGDPKAILIVNRGVNDG